MTCKHTHLLRPELHDVLLVTGGLCGLDTAAVELGVKVVTPLLQHVYVDVGHREEHAHYWVPDVHTISRVWLGPYRVKLLVKVLETVPFCPGVHGRLCLLLLPVTSEETLFWKL